MKQRIISALIAIPIFVLLMVYAPLWLFSLAWLAIIAVTAYEMARILGLQSKNHIAGFIVAAVFLSGISTYIGQSYFINIALFLCCFIVFLWLFFVPFLLYRYCQGKHLSLMSPLSQAMLIAMLVAFFNAIMILHRVLPAGLFIGLFVTIWASDAGAYFVGKSFGKTPFAPKISPNKTWEGFAGGLLFSMLSIFILIQLYKEFIDGYETLTFFTSLIAVIYASIGDLFESMLKRQAGIKDSGNIMPGHGGLYDRIDSWLPSMSIWAVSLCFITVIKALAYV